jgi:cbb3-type cytochrome oxidase maturation protein
MDNTVLTAAALLVVSLFLGLLVGMLFHRRVHAGQIADIDGDISALRKVLKDAQDRDRLVEHS